MTNWANSRIGAPPRQQMLQAPRQMAIYVFICENKHQVDTSRLCVEMLINIPNPMNIDKIAVPP